MSYGIFIGAALISWLGCHAYRKFALRTGFLDHPESRSAHQEPIPTGAGLVFGTVFVVGLAALASAQLMSWTTVLALFGAIPVAMMGLIDDAVALPWRLRAPMHFGAASWCIYWVGFPTLTIGAWDFNLGLAGIVFGIVSLVWLLNLYNFMDGIDGLAAGEAVFVVLSISLVTGGAADDWMLASMLLGGAVMGFLLINWPPAKVFMGDVGSGLLGLALGTMALASAASVWTWMILLTVFITDACLTITTRLIRGDNIAEAHSLHAYQHLTRSYGARNVLLGLMTVNCVWLLPLALLSELHREYGLYLLILASLPLLLGQYWCGAGRPSPRLVLLTGSAPGDS